MLNKNYPGNESFTITFTDLWYFSMRYPDICHKIFSKTSQGSRLYSFVTEVDQLDTCGDI